jgi:hypothetical protein
MSSGPIGIDAIDVSMVFEHAHELCLRTLELDYWPTASRPSLLDERCAYAFIVLSHGFYDSFYRTFIIFISDVNGYD